MWLGFRVPPASCLNRKSARSPTAHTEAKKFPPPNNEEWKASGGARAGRRGSCRGVAEVVRFLVRKKFAQKLAILHKSKPPRKIAPRAHARW